MRNGDPSQKYIYHTNLRGDIVTVTDSANTIQAQYSYDPWGTQTSYTGTITQPLRYAGYYYDDETGLYYLKSRYYSPETGRFITKDGYGYVRYGDSKTLNLYNYCGGNPINGVDPNGNDYVGEATVSGVVVDANEYEYLSNMAENDTDAGNRVWAQALLDQYESTVSGQHLEGYGDINLTVIGTFFVGLTSGVMTDNTGNNSYSGIAIGLPGVAMSGTGSTTYSITEGLNGAVQLQAFGGAFQGGVTSSGFFWEAGGGAGSTPINGSVFIYYVK